MKKIVILAILSAAGLSSAGAQNPETLAQAQIFAGQQKKPILVEFYRQD